MTPVERSDDRAKDPAGLARLDQLVAMRRNIARTVPLNVVLGFACLMIAIRHGLAMIGLVWFGCCVVVNALRMVQVRGRMLRRDVGSDLDRLVARRLRRLAAASLISGLVWSCVPFLCTGYTGSQSVFYLSIVAGITAGAVVAGVPFAAVPICFIIAPLLSLIFCMLRIGTVDQDALAASTVLYLAMLVRSAIDGERRFRRTSVLKHEANAMAASLAIANRQAVEYAKLQSVRASHDGLTGLLNRAGLMQAMDARLALPGRVLCVAILDLDRFKSVNDLFGHRTGNAVLIEVGHRLRNALDERCAIARLGGDEFAVIFDPADIGETPSALAQRLIAMIAVPFAMCESICLGVSIGIDVLAKGGVAEDALAHADAALYDAKSGGRNRFCLFGQELRARLARQLDIERNLPAALAAHQVEVWFQPLLGGGGRVPSGFEALIRWRHPVHGWISPPDLIHVAANAGLSEQVVRFVLREACGMIAMLRATGRSDLVVAMNVSPREVARLAVDDLVLEALASAGLPAGMLEIEITEETAMDMEAARGKLSRLSRAGVRLAIDDFGAGYSSLMSLRTLEADRIKIDRAFVSGMETSRSDQILVQAILNLGRSLGIEVVAEGVETEGELALLQSFGCSVMQGYLLGRPMRRTDALGWIDRTWPVRQDC